LELDERFNLVHGANASGKTSLLEAVAYLGRGKSFRGAANDRLVRHGTREFVVVGRVRTVERGSTPRGRDGQGGPASQGDGSPGGRRSAGGTWIGSRSTWNTASWMPGVAFARRCVSGARRCVRRGARRHWPAGIGNSLPRPCGCTRTGSGPSAGWRPPWRVRR